MPDVFERLERVPLRVNQGKAAVEMARPGNLARTFMRLGVALGHPDLRDVRYSRLTSFLSRYSVMQG